MKVLLLLTLTAIYVSAHSVDAKAQGVVELYELWSGPPGSRWFGKAHGKFQRFQPGSFLKSEGEIQPIGCSVLNVPRNTFVELSHTEADGAFVRFPPGQHFITGDTKKKGIARVDVYDFYPSVVCLYKLWSGPPGSQWFGRAHGDIQRFTPGVYPKSQQKIKPIGFSVILVPSNIFVRVSHTGRLEDSVVFGSGRHVFTGEIKSKGMCRIEVLDFPRGLELKEFEKDTRSGFWVKVLKKGKKRSSHSVDVRIHLDEPLKTTFDAFVRNPATGFRVKVTIEKGRHGWIKMGSVNPGEARRFSCPPGVDKSRYFIKGVAVYSARDVNHKTDPKKNYVAVRFGEPKSPSSWIEIRD